MTDSRPELPWILLDLPLLLLLLLLQVLHVDNADETASMLLLLLESLLVVFLDFHGSRLRPGQVDKRCCAHNKFEAKMAQP